MSERELFEAWYSEKLSITAKKLSEFRYYNVYACHPDFIEITAAWEAWQVSVNRQGYKLVPIEPTYDMYDAFYKEHDKYEDGDVKPFKESYKAMIGVAE